MVIFLIIAIAIAATLLAVQITLIIDEIEHQEKCWQHYLETGEDYPWKK